MNLRRYFRRQDLDREQREELESYLQIAEAENLARGMTHAEAAAAARRKLGNVTQVREEVYRMNTNVIVETLSRSVTHWWRLARRSPGFTAVSLLTLAIGIGANTAVFSVVNAVLLKPLPYPAPERLVSVQHTAPGAAGISDASGDLRLSASMFFTYFDHSRSFEHVGAWLSNTASVTGRGEPEEVRVIGVTQGLFETLQVPPFRGRWLSGEDQQPGAPGGVVLSYEYWQRKFGGAEDAIGSTLEVSALPRRIVGVMPPGFRVADVRTDVFIPFQFRREQLILPGFAFKAVARLKPGETIASASADITRLIPVWMDSWPAPPGVNPRNWERWRITPALRPLKQDVVGGIESALWVVMATIGLVLLIACANVTNLLLVRAESRHRELAVRAALGAGRARMVGEMLAESTVLAAAGGILGAGIAAAVVRLLVAGGPASLPRLQEIAIDARTALFAALISIAAGVTLGLLPALKHAGLRLGSSLRGEGRTGTPSAESHRTLDTLVVGQVALALVLLIASGLMIRTFLELSRVDPGFRDMEQVETFRVNLPQTLVPDAAILSHYQQLAENLGAIPGVVSAGFANTLPTDGQPPNWDSIMVEGRPPQPGQFPPMRRFKSVSPGFLEAMGTRLKAGRTYEWADVLENRRVLIVSDNLARELWGSAQSALGKRIQRGAAWEIVGVVEDVHDNGVWSAAPATVYWPSLSGQGGFLTRNLSFALKTRRTGDAGLIRQIEQAVWKVNSSLSIAALQPMSELHAQSMAATSFTMTMLAITGGMALLLGVIGLYGVISYTVARRQREVGIRIALGAEPGAVQRMFVGRAMSLTLVGVVLGLIAAAVVSQGMTKLLYGVKPVDPLTYASMALILLAAASWASFLPARRASRVNPVDSLRSE